MRRFAARPSGVSFDATGCVSASDTAASRSEGTPRSAGSIATAARSAKDEAERALANRTDAVEVAQAQAQLAQALAQLQALERLRRALKH